MVSLDGMKYFELARVKTEGESTVYDVFAPIRATERFAFGFYDWRGIFGSFEQLKELHAAGVFNGVAAPHVWIPTPPLPIAVAAAAAAVIVKNPVVTRRFWAGWLK